MLRPFLFKKYKYILLLYLYLFTLNVNAQIHGSCLPTGYHIPIYINDNLTRLFNEFQGNERNSSAELIRKSLEMIYESPELGNIGTQYRRYEEQFVTPRRGTTGLNGRGYNGTSVRMSNRMNDDGVQAINAVHSVCFLGLFQEKDYWVNNKENLANLQSTGDRIYVEPIDNRPDKYKGVFWVPEELSFVLYNPIYQVYGLPIEEPQIYRVDERFQRDIFERTGKTTTMGQYYSQKFYYLHIGEESCKIHTLYWNTDEVLREYLGLSLTLLNGIYTFGTRYRMPPCIYETNVRLNAPIIHRESNWEHCNLASLQADSTRIYVQSLDNRPTEFREPYWIPKQLSFILYNPNYCYYGLPIEIPQRKIVGKDLQKAILAKTAKKSEVMKFYAQKFLYYEEIEGKTNITTYTIYWDIDTLLKEYLGLQEVIGLDGNKINGVYFIKE